MPTPGNKESWLALGASILVGVIVWAPIKWLTGLGIASIDALWYAGAYPLMIGACFFISRWHPKRTWVLAFAMIFASYFTALAIVPGTGNLLPFEIALMLILTVPAALASRLGAHFWMRNLKHVETIG